MQLSGTFLSRRASSNHSAAGEFQHGIFSALCYAFGFIAAAAIFWGIFADVQDVSSVKGEISPADHTTFVQPLKDGVVDKVFVGNGDYVKKGDPLLRLQPDSALTELQHLQSDLARLQLRDMRLSAEFSGTKPDFGKLEETHFELAAQERLTYHARMHQRAQLLEALSSEISEVEAKIKTLDAEKAYIGAQLRTYFELLKLRARRQNGDPASSKLYMDVQAAIRKLQAAKVAADRKQTRSKEALTELTAKLLQVHKDNRTSLIGERARVNKIRKDIEQKIAEQKARIEELTLHAPSTGVITLKGPLKKASILQAGEFLGEITPVGKELTAKVKIPAGIARHVNAGDRAELRIEIAEGNIRGVISGQISEISDSKMLGANGEVYFPAVISVPEGALRHMKKSKPLAPGMPVRANIITGSESLMRRIIRPIYQSTD